jgi:hypothetical protein
MICREQVIAHTAVNNPLDMKVRDCEDLANDINACEGIRAIGMVSAAPVHQHLEWRISLAATLQEYLL